MPELSSEWLYWALMNGLPALFATTMFLLVPAFDRNFAWNVTDRRSGIALGTGFLMRAGLFISVILAGHFGQIRWMLTGNTIYALILLGATLVFGELFKWRRFIAFGWLYLYIEEPVWLLSLVPEAETPWLAAGGASAAGAAVSPYLQVVLWIEAAVLLLVGLALYFPNWTTRVWPWKPDTVSAIVISGFPISWATWAGTMALMSDWTAIRTGVLLNMLWLAAVSVSLVVFNKRFDLSNPVTRRFGLLHLAFLILLGIGYLLQA